MGERLAGFLIDAVDHLNFVESALLCADGDTARTLAHERLSLLRKAAARTADTLERAIADALDAFTPEDCANCFTAAGYGST